MPQHLPLSSTTGIRRTRFSTIALQQSSRLASNDKITQGVDMQSPTAIPRGFLPWAIDRQVISRSVIAPIGLIVPALYTTGISPQSCSIMSSAASLRLVAGVQHAGSGVITSFTWNRLSFVSLVIIIYLLRNRPCHSRTTRGIEIEQVV